MNIQRVPQGFDGNSGPSAQHRVHRTAGTRRVFQAFPVASAGFRSQTFLSPAAGNASRYTDAV
jgi:hypothetical protein